MDRLKDLSEMQLRDRARKLREDVGVALSPKARTKAQADLVLVEKELARRFDGRHPVRRAVARALASLGRGQS